MFAAVVPHGKQAWFFKLVAPAADAEKLQQPFDDFVKSIELGEPGATPKWKLPEGWTEKAGGGEMRTATIEIPHEGAPLELTVSSLPFDEEWDPFLERNVTRWLGQLQQRVPLSIEEIEKIGRKLPVEGGEATAFELVGVMERKGPMSGAMPPGHPPIGGAGATTGAPVTTRASAEPAPPAEASTTSSASADFTAQTPPGWKAGPARPMRKATYLVSTGDGAAEVSINSFPAVPMMADPLANARRWAGELGLDSMTDDQLRAATTEMKVGGTAGHYFELLTPADAAKPQATLAAMAPREGEIWFFKLKGDRAAVEAQREAFRKFLESVKFAGDK